MLMTISKDLIRQHLVLRAAAAGIEINDEWDFPATFEDDVEEAESYYRICEDAPCCGCCGTSLYGNNEDVEYDEADFGSDEFEYFLDD